VRDAMMKSGDFNPIDLPLRVKMAYESFMKMEPNAVLPDLAEY